MIQKIKFNSQEDLNKFLAGGRVVYSITHYPYPYTNSYTVVYESSEVSQKKEMDYSDQFIHLLIGGGHLSYDDKTGVYKVLSSESNIAALLLAENHTTQMNVLLKLNVTDLSVAENILKSMRVLKNFQEKVKKGEIK